MTGDEPRDDPSIPDDAALLRRVTPTKFVPLPEGGVRLSSSTFEEMPDRATGVRAMSMLVEGKVVELGSSATDLVAGKAGWGVVAVSARLIRECGLRIVWAPTPLEGSLSEAHVHVFGKPTGSIQKRLVAGCERRVWPPD